MTTISRNPFLCSIYRQSKIDRRFQEKRNNHLQKIKEDPEYRKLHGNKRAFGQARRRAKEKGVTLPKVAWMDRPEVSVPLDG